MDHDDRRERPLPLGRPRQVELQLGRAGLGVDDVVLVMGGSSARTATEASSAARPRPIVSRRLMVASKGTRAFHAVAQGRREERGEQDTLLRSPCDPCAMREVPFAQPAWTAVICTVVWYCRWPRSPPQFFRRRNFWMMIFLSRNCRTTLPTTEPPRQRVADRGALAAGDEQHPVEGDLAARALRSAMEGDVSPS